MDINNLDQAVRLHNKLNALSIQRSDVTGFLCFQGSVCANKPAISLAVAAMITEIDRQIQQAEKEVLDLS